MSEQDHCMCYCKCGSDCKCSTCDCPKGYCKHGEGCAHELSQCRCKPGEQCGLVRCGKPCYCVTGIYESCRAQEALCDCCKTDTHHPHHDCCHGPK